MDIAGYSRELCGGTHVRSTAVIGPFRILTETSSAANVRRIEAVTGPAAVQLLREHDRLLLDASSALRTGPADVPSAVRERERERRELEKRASRQGSGADALDMDSLLASAADVDGVPVLAASVEVPDAQALLTLADRLKGRLADAAIALGTVSDGRVHLLVSVAPSLVGRGVKAPDVVKAAAAKVGGGGGGRDTLAQAGGREPQRLGEAIEAAEAAIIAALEA